MNKDGIVTLGLALGFLIPISVVGYVLLHNDGSTAANTPNVAFVTTGPDYNAYMKSGFISLNNSTSPSNANVEFIHQPNTGQVDLFNALELFNNFNGTSRGGLWFNGTLPNGVTMYVTNATINSYNPGANSTSGWAETNSFSILIPNPARGVFAYISFKCSTGSTVTGSFSVQP